MMRFLVPLICVLTAASLVSCADPSHPRTGATTFSDENAADASGKKPDDATTAETNETAEEKMKREAVENAPVLVQGEVKRELPAYKVPNFLAERLKEVRPDMVVAHSERFSVYNQHLHVVAKDSSMTFTGMLRIPGQPDEALELRCHYDPKSEPWSCDDMFPTDPKVAEQKRLQATVNCLDAQRCSQVGVELFVSIKGKIESQLFQNQKFTARLAGSGDADDEDLESDDGEANSPDDGNLHPIQPVDQKKEKPVEKKIIIIEPPKPTGAELLEIENAKKERARLEKLQKEQDKLNAAQKEKLKRDLARQAVLDAERAKREKAARDKAAAETKAAQEKADREQAAAEKAERERLAKEKAAAEQARAEKEKRDQAKRDQEAKRAETKPAQEQPELNDQQIADLMDDANSALELTTPIPMPAPRKSKHSIANIEKLRPPVKSKVRKQAIRYHSSGSLQSGVQLTNGPGLTCRGSTSWGTDLTLWLIRNAASAMNTKFKGKYPVHVSSISKQYGGPSGHSSHQNGLDADISYPSSKPQDGLWFACGSPGACGSRAVLPELDEERFFYFLKKLNCVDGRPIIAMFLDSALKRHMCRWATQHGEAVQDPNSCAYQTLQALKHWPGHQNHVHVRFKCQDKPNCQDDTVSLGRGNGC